MNLDILVSFSLFILRIPLSVLDNMSMIGLVINKQVKSSVMEMSGSFCF